MSTSKAPDYKASLNQLEGMLDEYLGHKAPALPDNAKETLVSFAPYLAIIGIVISLPAIFAILGIGAMMGPLSAFGGVPYMMSYGLGYYLSIAVLVVSVVLEGMAIPGLFKRSIGAWRLMYYAALVSFVASVLQGNLGGALLGAVIGMYFLFQVKALYK
jgi:hypothetical protein